MIKLLGRAIGGAILGIKQTRSPYMMVWWLNDNCSAWISSDAQDRAALALVCMFISCLTKSLAASTKEEQRGSTPIYAGCCLESSSNGMQHMEEWTCLL